MSLVNDMLRDLDARLRDTRAKGAGTEKLVPAADESGRNAAARHQKLVVAVVILLAAAAGMALALYLGATRDTSGRINLPVAQTPGQTQSGSGPESEPGSGSGSESGSESGGSSDNTTEGGDQGDPQFEALSERLAQLEAANRRLQQEETGPDAASASGDNEDGEDGGEAAVPPRDNPLTAGSNDEGDWDPRDWSGPARQEVAEASPQMEAPRVETSVLEPIPAGGDESAGTATRTPREPSFVERDLARVQDALALWSNGRRTEALESLDQFTLDNPQAHLSREMLGKLLLQRGETAIAMQVADIGLQIAPMHNGYRKLKARLLMAANRPAEAVDLLEDRPPSAEGDTEYHALLATAALASGQYRVARRSYESLLGVDDSEGRWWYGLATALEGQGQPGNATLAYQRAQRSSTLSGRLRQRSEERIAQLTAP